jgi:hypothetical protein
VAVHDAGFFGVGEEGSGERNWFEPLVQWKVPQAVGRVVLVLCFGETAVAHGNAGIRQESICSRLVRKDAPTHAKCSSRKRK